MTIQQAYDQYYSTGLYDRRYPGPNRRAMAILQRCLLAGSTVIDIGAGNGRYALPLAAMGYRVVAVEPSGAGRARMAERVAEGGFHGAVTVHADLAELAPSVLAGCQAAMLLFGVLGHLTYSERSRLLGALSQSMTPGARLLGSVPNRYRRFRRDQREAAVDDGGAPPRVRYQRSWGPDALTLELSLFSPDETRAELSRAGWRCDSLSVESILPEAVITSRRVFAHLDAAMSSVAPARIGYGIFFEATNVRQGVGSPAQPPARRG